MLQKACFRRFIKTVLIASVLMDVYKTTKNPATHNACPARLLAGLESCHRIGHRIAVSASIFFAVDIFRIKVHSHASVKCQAAEISNQSAGNRRYWIRTVENIFHTTVKIVDCFRCLELHACM